MTIKARLVERRTDTVGHGDEISRKKCRRRTKRPTALQRLFVSCQDVFKGPGTVPTPGDVQKLRHILDGMMPEHFGLRGDLQFFNQNGVRGIPRVTTTTIYKCNNFSLCIFFLPATAVIPLHNHPGMTVFSKLLLGTMHIKAYDWVDPVNSDDSAP
uniref:cysteine dioxygenase n=1 Tax=Davidia involucrata TaxID=16924 RepID=A0A5B7AX19_DAVIN